MEDSNKPENLPFKVFFITSNQSSLDKRIEYTLSKKGMINLRKVHSKVEKYKGEDFSISIFCFDIENKDLRTHDYDKESQKYRAVIKLKQKIGYGRENRFKGYFLFKETKNNFIFDFKFEDEIRYLGNTPAPPSIKFPQSTQLKLYNETFKILKIEQDSDFIKDLMINCQALLRGRIYEIDLFLEMINTCYLSKSINTLLLSFNLKKTKLPNT